MAHEWFAIDAAAQRRDAKLSALPSLVRKRRDPSRCRLAPTLVNGSRAVEPDSEQADDGYAIIYAILSWNLILSCMQYRFPFALLPQGSFGISLIAPTPVDDVQ